jgi:hypothetical protein
MLKPYYDTIYANLAEVFEYPQSYFPIGLYSYKDIPFDYAEITEGIFELTPRMICIIYENSTMKEIEIDSDSDIFDIEYEEITISKYRNRKYRIYKKINLIKYFIQLICIYMTKFYYVILKLYKKKVE